MVRKFLLFFTFISLSNLFSEGYLRDLEELGYCVIPDVISQDETGVLYSRVWHEFVERAWPECRMEDRSNWEEAFPMHNTGGIFAGPAGQTQVMWDLRQDPRIVDVFAKIWNTDDLIVSMDGLCIMCPTEIREGDIEPWPHVDQGFLRNKQGIWHNNNPPEGFESESVLSTGPFTVQGQFLFEDSFEGDGGFYCIPKSHLEFEEFAPRLQAIREMDISRKERYQLIFEIFGPGEHIKAPKGSLILWDSRTVHWNQHAMQRDNSKVRMVGYLCYAPKARLTEKGRMLRKKAFDEGVSTGHNPSYPELKFTKDHIHQNFLRYLEDPGYVQPEIVLTPLGESLLN